MNQLTFKITVLLLLCLSAKSLAQISSNAFYSEETKYKGTSPNDPVFFYKDISTASLTAPSDGNTYDYNWYSYSTASKSFDVLIQSDLGMTNSTLMNIEENGYMLSVDDGAGTVNNYYCWNFVPVPQIDSVGVPFASCDNIRLTAYTRSKVLSYYDHHGDNSSIDIDYGYTWTSSPTGDIAEITAYTGMINAPYEDTEYKVEVGVKFSPTIKPVTAQYKYEAIAVNAKFSFKKEGTADNEAKEGSAPMVVRFTDESIGNVTDWEWTFGSAGKDFVPDPIFTFQKYLKDGYPVVLTVRNTDTACESETTPETFTVFEMVIKVPNAFTPFSSPGDNDEFKILFRSVKKYNILVYNRWGRRVYQSDDPEAGWDGKIGNQRAEPGVYFYQIEAEGHNRDERMKLEGAIHLIVN